ncbi:hypothetical protein M9H77_30232 [Catharanthus roseus]|uniref:Uncharacterized protein n=1 Tax=Catharanthus roseus TaxID=4058 RepID=A0ACB9ZYJ1_CATRO|nr:hypothetical protein M9H77_30232 [Catharanthus roseus]
MEDMRRDITNISVEQIGQSNIRGHDNPHTQRGYGNYNYHGSFERRVQAPISSMIVVDTPLLEVEEEEAKPTIYPTVAGRILVKEYFESSTYRRFTKQLNGVY